MTASVSYTNLALSALGITPTIAKVYDSAVPEGNVVSTSPEAGTEITSSTQVTPVSYTHLDVYKRQLL